MPQSEPTCPPEVLALIAWYPDELSQPELESVEAHAAQCAECRREIEAVSSGAEVEVLAPDPERVLARTLAQVEITEADQWNEHLSAPRRKRAMRWLREHEVNVPGVATPIPYSKGIPMVASFGAAVILAAALYAQAPSWFATDSEVSQSQQIDSPQLVVVFKEDASAQAIASALRAIGGQVVSGPTPFGRYTVALSPDADPEAAAKQLLAEIGVAVYAEPSPR